MWEPGWLVQFQFKVVAEFAYGRDVKVSCLRKRHYRWTFVWPKMWSRAFSTERPFRLKKLDEPEGELTRFFWGN